MPQYRIPFYGTVLVEANTVAEAEVSAGSWVRSMKQATHAVEVERPTTGKICALDLWIHEQPTDVSQSFATYLENNRADELDEAGRANYHVGFQIDWELFERGRRVTKKSGG